MNINELRSLVLFSQTGSIQKTASLCQVNRSTISRCISRLEKEAKVQLFIQGTKGLKITNAGQRYVTTAQEIIAIYDQLYQECHAVQEIGR